MKLVAPQVGEAKVYAIPSLPLEIRGDETGPVEIGIGEVPRQKFASRKSARQCDRSGQQGPLEHRADQRRSGHRRTAQAGCTETAAAQIRAAQVSIRQIGPAEIGAAQAGFAQIDTPQDHAAEVATALTVTSNQGSPVHRPRAR